MSGVSLPTAMSELKLNDSILLQLECPVCFHTCSSPIYMCVNGHNVCASCRKQIWECPVCRAPGSPTSRNLAMETVSNQLLVPCKYRKQGCKVRRVLHELEAHYRECQHKYTCLVHVDGRQCDWSGCRTALREHVSVMHARHVWDLDKLYYLIYCSKGKDFLNIGLYVLRDELFWFNSRYIDDESNYYYYLQYVGPKENAGNFTMELKVTSKDGTSAACSFVRSPIGLSQDFKSDRNTVVLSRHFFDMFTQGENRLLLSVTVK